MNRKQKIKRGDLFYADLGNSMFSEQYGIRPVIVLSNNKNNEYSPTIIIAPLTTKIKKESLLVHTYITKDKENNLSLNSMVLLEQIKTIDKKRLFSKIGTVCDEDLKRIDKSLKISLNL